MDRDLVLLILKALTWVTVFKLLVYSVNNTHCTYNVKFISFLEFTKLNGYVLNSDCEEQIKRLVERFNMDADPATLHHHWRILVFQILEDNDFFCKVQNSEPSEFWPVVLRKFTGMDTDLYRFITSALAVPFRHWS